MKVERAGSGTQPFGHAALDELRRDLAFERAYVDAAFQLFDTLRAEPPPWQKVLGVFATLAGAESGWLWQCDGETLSPLAELSAERPFAGPAERAFADVLASTPLAEQPTVSLLASEPSTDEDEASRLGGPRALRVLLRSDTAPIVVMLLSNLQSPYPGECALARLVGLSKLAGIALTQRLERAAWEQSLRARDDVLGSVAHDLRNPLNVVTTASSMLLDRQLDTRTRRPLERILRAAQRAERLIDDLLDVSAIESGHFSVDQQPCDAAATILAAIELQEGLAASASVILASDLAPGLPTMFADTERVLEVLENLVSNAVKFTPAGGTIELGARSRGNQLLFWVKDTGCGIPKDQQAHLFDRFWQAAKGDRRGAGLGLTICRAIVEAHGGRIWVESAPNAGTTMFFTVPALEATAGTDSKEMVSILLVDDRRENLLSLKAVLDRPDYRLVTARSGEEALRCVLRETFAVVLMDIAMPGMDGLEVATHLKALERSRDVPIIFITAFGDDPAEIHRAYSAGAADYLVKPLDAEIVRRKVAVFVDLNRQKRARVAGSLAT